MFTFNTKKKSPLAAAIANVTSVIASQGDDFANRADNQLMLSAESLSTVDNDNLIASAESIQVAIASSFEPETEDGNAITISPEGFKAATIAALGSTDARAYAEVATNVSISPESVVPQSTGTNGTIDYRLTKSAESFDKGVANVAAGFSIVVNAITAKADAYSEAFYPTYVMEPNKAIFTITVENSYVEATAQHDGKGASLKVNRRSLNDAYADASILALPTTRLYPTVLSDGSNKQFFVDDALVSPRDIMVGDTTVSVAPIAIDTDFNMLGLANGSGLFGGETLNTTDQLDGRMALEALYVRVTTKDGANPDVVSVLKIRTAGMPKHLFFPALEGEGREARLSFETKGLLIAGDMLDHQNQVPAALAVLTSNDLTLSLAVNVSGTLSQTYSNGNLYASKVKAHGITDANGVELSVASGPGKAIADNTTFDVIGFDLDTALTNSNRRTLGTELNKDTVTEAFSVPLAPPLSIVSSMANKGNDEKNIRDLIELSRALTANSAVTSQLNYADALKASVRPGGNFDSVEGIGRHVITPYFKDVEIDLGASGILLNRRSDEVAADARAVIVNRIRVECHEMLRESRYGTRLKQINGGSNERPHIQFGTDEVLPIHMFSDLTVGAELFVGIDNSVVTTPDTRMYNKIIATFTRKNHTGKPDGMSAGVRAFIPELTSAYDTQREGATVHEVTTQPREVHLNLLPCMIVFTIKNAELLYTK